MGNKEAILQLPIALTPHLTLKARVTYAEESQSSTPILPACKHEDHKPQDPRFKSAVFEMKSAQGVFYTVYVDEDGFPCVEATGTATKLPIVFTVISSCMDSLQAKGKVQKSRKWILNLEYTG